MDKTLYSRYKHIKERCFNPNSKSYKRYGGRGIKMCDEWLNNYQAFEDWCMANGFKKGLAIDRIDNDKDYSPDNCRFVTLKENNQNRCTSKWYTIGGVTKNLQQWCDIYKVKRGTVMTRLQHGWELEKALSEPVKKGRDRTALLGRQFGNLEVVEYAGDEYIGKDNNSRWICKCSCGNTAIVGSNKLLSGHTKSCGCLVSKQAKERMLTNNPMREEKQRKRMVEHNPMRKDVENGRIFNTGRSGGRGS